ncbi:uncharacterized protein BXZ73DRAFT_106784 [Epithele typhae]|uniref:uncharacterized protein n=1 Tax=Epithele typhae TaxID=378194 RepID=UPI0020082364|nr:uncharacterized protein BXZ73DRAFT_106784 [Epithele typhae]KAH9913880.1 hypothetical protein BXZ73DRAFT_106784 [Epithele typhae]
MQILSDNDHPRSQTPVTDASMSTQVVTSTPHPVGPRPARELDTETVHTTLPKDQIPVAVAEIPCVSDVACDTIDDQRQRSRTPPVDEPLAKRRKTSNVVTVDMDVGFRDGLFWWSDGNVVVRAGSILFKLHRSRLSMFCGYFRQLLDAGGESATSRECIDDCDVYDVPGSITASEFKSFLFVLEHPMPFEPHVHSTQAVAILRAAIALSSVPIISIAKRYLSTMWDSTLCPPPTTRNPQLSFDGAVAVVRIARDCDMADTLRLAYYEILASAEFDLELQSNGPSKKLTEEELRRLKKSRNHLRHIWLKYCLECGPHNGSPSVPARCAALEAGCPLTSCCVDAAGEPLSGAAREARWFRYVLEEQLKVHELLDPYRYFTDEKRKHLEMACACYSPKFTSVYRCRLRLQLSAFRLPPISLPPPPPVSLSSASSPRTSRFIPLLLALVLSSRAGPTSRGTSSKSPHAIPFTSPFARLPALASHHRLRGVVSDRAREWHTL